MFNNILSQQFWAMEANYLKQFLENVQVKSYSDVEAKAINKSTSVIKPYKNQNGIAEISINGPLMKRVPWVLSFLFGIQSMEIIGNVFNAALNDKDIDAIFLDIDSPGGSVDGTQALADIVYNGRGKKPILAFANGTMASAAYWIGSGADTIVLADSTSRIGSIGTVGVHFQYAEQAKQKGIQIHVFHSGQYKRIGNVFEKLTKKDIEYIDGQFEYLHNIFISGVEKNIGRTLSSDAREARIYIGKQAVDAGLAHGIMNKNKAMRKLKSMIGTHTSTSHSKSKTSTKGNDMKFMNATLLDVVREIQATGDLDSLQALESDLLNEADRREGKASDWIEQREAKGLKDNIVSLVSQRRRMLLAQPKVLERQEEYARGQAIAKAIFPNR